MTYIVLAAGYATRLYPLTMNFPKPLLMVQGKPIIDRLLDDVISIDSIHECVVVTNHRYYDHFIAWSVKKDYSVPLVVLDDGTSSNETRLGAVIDLLFAIDSLSLNDDLLVMAGDNVVDFSFASFVQYAWRKGNSCVMRYHEPDPTKIMKAAALEVNWEDRVLKMEEKPRNPFSNWCCPPFYAYMKRNLPLIDEAIAHGCSTDAPGSLAAWLSQRTALFAMAMPGKRYDVGDFASFQYVQDIIMSNNLI